MTLSIEISPSAMPEIGLQCNLTCTVARVENLDPTIVYQWFKDRVMISNVTDSVLSIQSLKHSDAGEYMCVATWSSERVIPSFTTIISNTYFICFTPGMCTCMMGFLPPEH